MANATKSTNDSSLSPIFIFAGCSLAFFAGCTGVLGGSDKSGSDSSDGSRANGGDQADGDVTLVNRPAGFPPTAAEFSPAPLSAGRLTPAQYVASLVSIFGPDVPKPNALDPVARSSDSLLMSSGRATINQLSTVAQFEQAAYAVANWVFADEARRSGLGICSPASADDPCVSTSLESIGKRLWRRPLSADELESVLQLRATLESQLGDADVALSYAVAFLLQSPHFLYRIENGQPSDRDGWLQLTPFEMATRLAYGLTGTTPDEQLLAAAESGDLDTAEGIRTQASRLVSSDAGVESAVFLLDDYIHYSELEHLAKPTGIWSESLRNSMRGEADLLSRAAVAGGDFRELFTAKTTSVNKELSDFYGWTWPGGDESNYVEVPLPEGRRGLLTTGAVLARYGSSETSMILRGRFVRNGLFCGEVPDPPGEIPELEPVEPPPGMTPSRSASVIRQETPPCSGCHIPMDPLGFAYDKFDTLGQDHPEEEGIATRSDGELTKAGYDEEVIEFAGPEELADLIAESPVFMECLVRNIHGRLTLRNVALGETAEFPELANSFAESGYDLSALILEIVSSDGFRYVVTEDNEEGQ